MMPKEQNDLILEAINSAERSLALAKKLLIGVQPEGSGVLGKFDGEFLVSEKGKKYQVPPNYASKSVLVVGDVLRMMGQGERVLFKQLDKVDRLEIKGVLTKKDGLWSVVTEEGNFWVLPASIKFHQGEIGDEAEVLVPKEYKKLKSEWAALVRVIREGGEKKASKEKIPARTPPQVKEEVREESIPGGPKPPVVVSAPKPEKEKAKVEPRSTVEVLIKAGKRTAKKPPARTDVVVQAKRTPEKARSDKKIPVEKKEERKMEDKKKELKGEIRIDEEGLR